MTSHRNKNAARGFETEIEKCREDGHWKRVIELAIQLKARSPQHESLAHFLMGEGKLESYLSSFPPLAEHRARAAAELGEAGALLAEAAGGEGGQRAGVALDAHLLLAKALYAQGDRRKALEHFHKADLATLSEKDLPLRSLRIVAESFAVRALCLEEELGAGAWAGAGSGAGAETGTAGARLRQQDDSAELVRSLEMATDLALLYGQRVASAGASAAPPGATLDACVARAAQVMIRLQQREAALRQCRRVLRAEEGAPPPGAAGAAAGGAAAGGGARLGAARALAELLLRQAPGDRYEPPPPPPPPPDRVSPWKPRQYNGLNQFVPESPHEECLLALLVGEAVAARAAVLSQAAEFTAAREHAARNARSVLDLLAVCTARFQLHSLYKESLERAMKFSFECGHVWRQRVLCCVCCARSASGASGATGASACPAAREVRGVLRVALRLCPRDVPLRLLRARGCYREGTLEEGISLAMEAVQLSEDGGRYLARACLTVGMGHQRVAAKADRCPAQRALSSQAALEFLRRAVSLDPADHVALYHLALHHARRGEHRHAKECVRSCLSLVWWHAGALRLLAALCGSRRGATLAAAVARDQWPAAAWPRALLRREGAEVLPKGKELLSFLHPEPDSDEESDGGGGGGGGGLWPAGSRGQRAAAWLTLGRLCVAGGRGAAAAGCVAEAAQLAPTAHLVHYTRGLVHAYGGEWEEARQSFMDALALCPTHTETMMQLGAAWYALGWPRLGAGWLRSALALGGRRAAPWRRLAAALRAQGDPAAACDACAQALQLYHDQPRLSLEMDDIF